MSRITEIAKVEYPDSLEDDLYPMKLQWKVKAERRAYVAGYQRSQTEIVDNLRDLLARQKECLERIYSLLDNAKQ